MRFSLMTLAFCLAAACSSKAKTTTTPEPNTVPNVDKGTTTQPIGKNAEQPVAEPIAGPTKIECSTKGDERILELRTKGKGCELGYTKGGQEGIVASAANGTSYCETTLNKIRDRLKGSGFECK